MSDLIAPVRNGEVQTTTSSTTKSSSSASTKNDLDKDAFLKLLAAQMKYQDPMSPNNDTEFIAQLATFSQLEQLNNLSTVTQNSQAFSLVGKNVSIKTEDSAGATTYVEGKVDFVNMLGTKAQLSVNGTLYAIDQLDSVVDDTYKAKQNQPGIKDSVALNYDAYIPKDLTFTVNLGTGDYAASKVAIGINNTVIDSSLVTLNDNKVTIKSAALENLDSGKYNVTVAFNDSSQTIMKDKVTLQVQNAAKSTASATDTTSGTSGTTNTTANTTTDTSVTA